VLGSFAYWGLTLDVPSVGGTSKVIWVVGVELLVILDYDRLADATSGLVFSG
jgi:hypothetical protein